MPSQCRIPLIRSPSEDGLKYFIFTGTAQERSEKVAWVFPGRRDGKPIQETKRVLESLRQASGVPAGEDMISAERRHRIRLRWVFRHAGSLSALSISLAFFDETLEFGVVLQTRQIGIPCHPIPLG